MTMCLDWRHHRIATHHAQNPHRLTALVSLRGLPHKSLGCKGPLPVGLNGDEARSGAHGLCHDQCRVATHAPNLHSLPGLVLSDELPQQRSFLWADKRHPFLRRGHCLCHSGMRCSCHQSLIAGTEEKHQSIRAVIECGEERESCGKNWKEGTSDAPGDAAAALANSPSAPSLQGGAGSSQN